VDDGSAAVSSSADHKIFSVGSIREFHEVLTETALEINGESQALLPLAQCLLQTACNGRRLEARLGLSAESDGAASVQLLLDALFDSSATAALLGDKNGNSNISMFIGTGGDGYGSGGMPMAAQVPFGMARVGPDTSIGPVVIPWRHTGGYHYCDTDVRAFSHVHLVGAGLMDLGLLGVMPVTSSDDTIILAEQYRSPFDHASESVDQPGYYAVTLSRWGVRAELTATSNVGYHRYTYSTAGLPQVVLFDLGHTLYPDAQAADTYVTVDATARQI
jgi:putative alpha-1,2-mannosidase